MSGAIIGRDAGRPVFAVIGAGYGDEGKGLLTDALAAGLGPGTVVVRHNGGGQAGHTVRLADGRAHVFHHVGAGTFAGAATYLGRRFVSNPLVLADEIAALARLGFSPRIAADARGLLTTPWDMMINQFVEAARGQARHGSCGLGFGETIERCGDPRYATRLSDLGGDLGALRTRFDRIRRDWVPRRLTRLGHPGLWLRHRDLILFEAGMERALVQAVAMLAQVDLVAGARDAVPRDAPVVFEGAQGLGLDAERGAFPHVTRSRTGLANVLDVAAELGLARIEAVYATRAYVTRHGAGPLAHERAGPPGPRVADPTNRPNPWQGRLRFGTLDLDALGGAIRADLADANGTGIAVSPRLALTCLDQITDTGAAWIEEGRPVTGSPEALAARCATAIPGAPEPIASRGPTRTTLQGLPVHAPA